MLSYISVAMVSYISQSVKIFLFFLIFNFAFPSFVSSFLSPWRCFIKVGCRILVIVSSFKKEKTEIAFWQNLSMLLCCFISLASSKPGSVVIYFNYLIFNLSYLLCASSWRRSELSHSTFSPLRDHKSQYRLQIVPVGFLIEFRNLSACWIFHFQLSVLASRKIWKQTHGEFWAHTPNWISICIVIIPLECI